MSTDELAGTAGILISVACSYVPGLADKYAALDGTQKRLVMLLALVLAAALVYGLSCANVVAVITCSQRDLVGLLRTVVLAIVANQSTYWITPKRQG
jgi:hypothetical protein